MISKQATWNWTEEYQNAFDHMNKSISIEILSVYSSFSKPFVIYTDVSKVQLGAVISQDNKPIPFYSRKLNPARVNIMTTEIELSSIVETLKEHFRDILSGEQIQVYTEHQNLKHIYFNTCWKNLVQN